MLEMGCGCGVASVLGALAGVPKVTALDINPAAVHSTQLNAQRHGVADRVTALVSDLYAAVDEDETYDLIFWNSPFIQTGSEQPLESPLAYHFFDPGYAMHERFLRESTRRLAPDGRLFLGYSFAMGSSDRLREVVGVAGFRVEVFVQETFSVPPQELGTSPVYAACADDDGKVHIDFTLLELIR
jgi:release factor glutamine methyltransferase